MNDGARTASRPETVDIAHFWTEGDGQKMFDAVLESFRSRRPDVAVDARSYDNHGLTIKSRILQEDPPTLFVEWPDQNLQPYHSAGALRDITEVWETNGWTDAFIEGPRTRSMMDGKYVGLPVDIHRMNNVFYHVDLVEEIGVDPSRVSDPREFLEVLEQCADGGVIGMEQPMKNPSTILQLFANIVIGQFGAETFEGITGGDTSAYHSEIREAVELVDAYAELAREDSAFVDMVEANDRFVDGQSVFFHQGDWMAGEYADLQGFEYGRDWERANFPGTDGVYMMGIDSIVAAEDGGFDEDARTFLEFVGSPAALEELNRIKGSIPPRKDVSMDAYPQFLRDQFADFKRARHFPAGHALQVTPQSFIEAKAAFSTYLSTHDVEQTARDLVEAYSD